MEDDAQNGYDHVDAHRSPCFVISPYVKRGSLDHRFYNTDSVLRDFERCRHGEGDFSDRMFNIIGFELWAGMTAPM